MVTRVNDNSTRHLRPRATQATDRNGTFGSRLANQKPKSG